MIYQNIALTFILAVLLGFAVFALADRAEQNAEAKRVQAIIEHCRLAAAMGDNDPACH